MNPRDLISKLAAEFDEESNAASDLWTWLPSYAAAAKHHTGHVSRPPVVDVMREAAAYFARLKYPRSSPCARERNLFACPCGEDHGVDVDLLFDYLKSESAPDEVLTWISDNNDHLTKHFSGMHIAIGKNDLDRLCVLHASGRLADLLRSPAVDAKATIHYVIPPNEVP